MDEQPTIKIDDPAFAKRLANLLIETRRRRDLSLDDIVRLAGDRLSRSQLKDFEAGTLALTEALVETVASVYGADLALILSERLPVVIEPGFILTGGITREFDATEPDSLLTEYLRMVRGLRQQQKAPVVDLRRSDIEVLAGFLHEADERVLDRLLVLMGATRARRVSMAVLLASGVAVIGLVGGAAALSLAGDEDGGGDGGTSGATTTSVVDSTDATVSSTTELPSPTTTVITTRPTSVATQANGSTPTTSTVAPTATTVVTTTSVATRVPATVAPRPAVTTPAPTTTVVDVGEPPLPPTTSAAEPTTTLPPGQPLSTVAPPPEPTAEVGPPPLPTEP